MESNHLLEIKIHHMGCIIGFTEWYEMAHFGETVHYHHREVFATLGAGYTIDKSHTDIQPWTIEGLANNGGPFTEPYHEPQGSPEGSIPYSKAKEKVQTLLSQLAILPGLRDMHKRSFVYLLEGDPKGVISYAPTLIQLKISDFK